MMKGLLDAVHVKECWTIVKWGLKSRLLLLLLQVSNIEPTIVVAN